MSLLSEACYCCGERGLSARPLNAQMTPRGENKGGDSGGGGGCGGSPLFQATHL